MPAAHARAGRSPIRGGRTCAHAIASPNTCSVDDAVDNPGPVVDDPPRERARAAPNRGPAPTGRGQHVDYMLRSDHPVYHNILWFQP